MAKKTTRKTAAAKAKSKSKTKMKAAARKPAPKSRAKNWAKSKAKPVATKKSSAKKGESRRATATPSENVFRRVFDRVKPIFQQPLDPRIKHLVEVFGTEAVVGLMEAYRQSRDAAHHDELREAMAQADSTAAPAPQAAPEPPKHGTWVWHELMTYDTGSAKRFYREMFGWESNDMEMMPGFNYTTFTKGGEHMGGMQTIRPEQGNMPSGWGVYIAVDDVDSAADKAEDLGGEIIVPAHDIPVGRWAMVKDPAGATLCLYRMKM